MSVSLRNVLSQRSPFAAGVAAFTLIEILVVLIIIAIMGSTLVLTLGDGGRDAKLEEETERLRAVLQLAVEEAQLNGVELGLVVERDAYQFVTFGQDRWTAINDDRAYRRHALPEGVQLSLKIEGFKLGKNARVPGVEIGDDGSVKLREEENENAKGEVDKTSDEASVGDDGIDATDVGSVAAEELSDKMQDDAAKRREQAGENKKPKSYLPQIFLLSSGEINPFVLAVGSEDDPARFYRVRGQFNGKVTVEGPLDGDLHNDLDMEWDDPAAPQRDGFDREQAVQ